MFLPFKAISALLCMLLSRIHSYRLVKPIKIYPLTRNFSRKPSLVSLFMAKFGFDKKVEIDPGDVKGTTLKILKYPHPLLRKENAMVEEFDEKLKQIAREMLLVMYSAEGIGLAAPQVGINQRIMVFNESGDRERPEKEMVLVNPSLVSSSEKETDIEEEGCLSFPLINGKVERFKSIQVEYQDLNGEKKMIELKGYPARIFQHEYDHLNKV